MAWRNGWIDDEELGRLAADYDRSPYAAYLTSLLSERT